MIAEYEHLFSVNTDFVISHFGNNFAKKAHKRELSREDSLEANKVLSEVLYPNGIADLLKSGRFSDITNFSSKNIYEITSKTSDDTRLIAKSAGLILVRPEMLHAYKLIERFLLLKEFEIDASLEKKVDFNHYWAIYNNGLIDPNSFLDFPTRTLVYTNGLCRLIVFTDPKKRYGINMMDEFCRLFKGKPGKTQRGTIRGDIVLKELLKVGVGDRLNKDLEFALDPIGMYRHIVDGNIPSDGVHNVCDYPFLHYTGAGVHIPNRAEALLNFEVLLDGQEKLFYR